MQGDTVCNTIFVFLYLQICVRDTRSSVKIELQFSQENIEDAAAVLNVDSNTQAMIEVCDNLAISCGNNENAFKYWTLAIPLGVKHRHKNYDLNYLLYFNI